MDSESDASIVSGTTIHSGSMSPGVAFSLLNRNICGNAASTSDYKSPIVPITISRFQNVIEEPVYCNPGKRKKQVTNDEESDEESSYSILCNYKQKAFTQAKTHQSREAVSVERHGGQGAVNTPQGCHDNRNDKQVENVTSIISKGYSPKETESQRYCPNEKPKRIVRELGGTRQTEDHQKESQDMNISQTGGSQVLFPDTQSSSRSMGKQVVPCSQTSSGTSTVSSKFKELDSNMTKEDMVEAFGKIKKIHTKIQENMKGKDMTEEQRENLKKKLAVVHSSLKNISEKMNYEKVRVTFDAKHSVKTVEDKDRLREQMRDLTQRQSTLKELLMKQTELTKYLKQNPGNSAESQFQKMTARGGSSVYANKVNDWLSRHQTSMLTVSSVQHSNLPANKHSKIDQSSGCVEPDLAVSAGTSGTEKAQVVQPKTVLTGTMNIESQAQQAVPLTATTSHSGRKQPTRTHISKYPNNNLVSNNKSRAASSIPQLQIPVHNPPPPLSSSSTMHMDQMKTKKSHSFKRPSEIIKSPPLFNPDSFLRKTRKSPPVKTTTISSFKSPPVSLSRPTEDRNISPSTVCSSDVFPVSCRELSRRIQERIESQKEAESQQASQSQMLSTGSQIMRNEPWLSQKNGSGDQSRKGAPQRIIFHGSQVQPQPATKSNANTCLNMEEEDEETMKEKYGGLKFPSLRTLIDLDVLFPAEKILTIQHGGKIFTSSLTDLGFIESKGGEIFTTPVKWLSAVKGGEVVKKGQAYKEIMYDGHSLKSYIDGEQKTSIEKIRARVRSDISECKGPTNIPPNTEQSKSSKRLVEDGDKELTELLYQCKLHLLDNTDLIPMDDLPENFWSSDFSNVHLSYAFWNQVDDWDSSVESLTRQ